MDQNQLEILRQSISENNRCQNWNQWREAHPDVYVDLSGSDLHQVTLVAVNLNGANLAGANLEGASLYEAKLDDTDFSGANLKEAKFGKVFGSDIKEAWLNRANLTGANLNKAYLHGVQMRQAKLKGANLSGANLNEADLWQADLSDAQIDGASVNLANLDGVILSGARIFGLRGRVSSAVNIRCIHLDIGETAENEFLEFANEQNAQELGRYLAQDEQQRNHFLINQFQQQRHPLVCLAEITARDGSQYRLLGKSAEDILWVVYRAERTSDGTPFLLYVLGPHARSTPTESWENLRKRFILMGMKAKKVRHPNIVRVLEIGYLTCRPMENHDRPFWLVENLQGETLENWATRANRADIAAVMMEIAQALRYLHHYSCILKREDFKGQQVESQDVPLVGKTGENALVHGNLNPGNIMIIDRHAQISTPEVIHWQDIAVGFSIHSSFADDAQLPQALLLPYRYMSPEQKRSIENLGPSSDIFSLGLVFYYMLTRTHFFGELIPAKQDEFGEALRNSECPQPLQKLILQMVSQDAGQRPTIRQVFSVLKPGVSKKSLWACAAVPILLVVGFLLYLAITSLPSGSPGTVSEKRESPPERPVDPPPVEETPPEIPPVSSEASLWALAESEEMALRVKAAMSPQAPEPLLEKLSRDSQPEVRLAVVQNPSTPVQLLQELSRSSTAQVKAAVAENPKTSAATLRQLLKDDEDSVRRAVVDHLNAALSQGRGDVGKYILRGDLYREQKMYEESCKDYQKAIDLIPDDTQTLSKLAMDLIELKRDPDAWRVLDTLIELEPDNLPNYVARGDLCFRMEEYGEAFKNWDHALKSGCKDTKAVSENMRKMAEQRQIKPELLAMLAGVHNDRVRCAVARNSRVDPRVLVQLAHDPDSDVRMAAVETRDDSIRQTMAKSKKIPADVLDKLARDARPSVRVEVASNERAPLSALGLLARDGDLQVRLAVVLNPAAPGEILAQLAQEKDPEIRSKLIDHPNLPGYIFAQLAQENWQMIPALVEKAPHKKSKKYADADYLGQLKNREPHGLGVRTHHNRDKYTGQFKNGEPDGNGICSWANGNKYVGQWQEGKIHGKGIYTWANGEEYQGEFIHSQKQGQGSYRWPDGRRYEGEYRDNKMTGTGTMTWPDKRQYQGEVQDGLPHGKGIYTWPNGERYEGEYAEGKFHGQGIQIWPDGRRYEGDYRQGKFHGKGTHLWPSGNKYIGEFINGQMHGYGTMYREDGTIMKKGIWRGGNFAGN